VIFPDFDGNLSFLEMSGIFPYLQFGQSACMFHISYGLQWRQGLRYIAVSNAATLSAEKDHITNSTGALIFPTLLEIYVVLK
jgi:hypothetical protein